MTKPLLFSLENGAVVFDLDGTLADTFRLHVEAYNRALAELSTASLSFDDYVRFCVGRGDTVIGFLRSRGVDLPPLLYSRKARYYDALAKDRLRLRPGLKRLIAGLRRAGVPVAIATSAHRLALQTFLRVAWPGPAPAVLVSRSDLPRSPKPHPGPYLLVARKLGIPPSLCLAFEDSPPGIQAAAEANMRCIALDNGLFLPQHLQRADAVIRDFSEVRLRTRTAITLVVDAK